MKHTSLQRILLFSLIITTCTPTQGFWDSNTLYSWKRQITGYIADVWNNPREHTAIINATTFLTAVGIGALAYCCWKKYNNNSSLAATDSSSSTSTSSSTEATEDSSNQLTNTTNLENNNSNPSTSSNSSTSSPLANSNKTFSYGLSTMKGRIRNTMEDTHKIILNDGNAFFGIFDGHGGKAAADYVAEHLHTNIAKYGLVKGFEATDKEFNKGTDTSGTTAVTAIVSRDQNNNNMKLSFAWAGDARGVLVDNRENVLYATDDHKPSRLSEIKRIINNNGFISVNTIKQGRLNTIKITKGMSDEDITSTIVTSSPDFPPRVNENLSTSRAIGDKKNPLVIATPDTHEIDLPNNARYIILACDGLWDVMSNEEAARIVTNIFAKKPILTTDPLIQTDEEYAQKKITINNLPLRTQPHEEGNNDTAIMAARALRDKANEKGSTDNISVLVVELDEKLVSTTSLTENSSSKSSSMVSSSFAASSSSIT